MFFLGCFQTFPKKKKIVKGAKGKMQKGPSFGQKFMSA